METGFLDPDEMFVIPPRPKPPRTVKIGKTFFFFGDRPQMWVGGVADSQTRSKPLKIFFDPNFTFRFPKSQKKTLGWVGG